MRKENLDHCKELVEKINGITALIEDIKKSKGWGFKTEKLSIFTKTPCPAGNYTLISTYEEGISYYRSSDQTSFYNVDNEALKQDILEVLEKHKKMMEDALEEL